MCHQLLENGTMAKLTGTPTARGLFVTFLPSRPLKWGFRMFIRSSFPTFRPQSTRTTKSEHPFIDFGLDSSPKSQLLKICENTKTLKNSQTSLGLRGKLWGRVDFYIEIFFLKSENDFKSDFSRAKV